jgi:hypothetical protein
MRFGLSLIAMMIIATLYSGEEFRPVLMSRNFFGVVRVEYNFKMHAYELIDGSTLHGMQSLDAVQRKDPWAYYHRAGPLGEIFKAAEERRPIQYIGAVGLGVGSIAAYGKPGQNITFYEINPMVISIARNSKLFTYISDCQAQVDIIEGDARLSLSKGPVHQFDLLLIDAFSSDSIPVHLLTREALELYMQNLSPSGIIGLHISSRHFNLRPVLGDLAAAAGLAGRVWNDRDSAQDGVVHDPAARGKIVSEWAILGRRAEDFGELQYDPKWEMLPRSGSKTPWSDDFSNIISTLNWSLSWEKVRGLLHL